MIRSLRRQFLRTKELSGQGLDPWANPVPAGHTHAELRLPSTPVFLPGELVEDMVHIGHDILEQLTAPTHRQACQAFVPAAWDLAAPGPHPLFFNMDFILARGASGRVCPRLIELQGFASMYASQLELGERYRPLLPDHGRALEHLLDGLTAETYRTLLRRAICGEYPAQQVALVDIKPQEQRNWAEFMLTKRDVGLRVICLSELVRRGDQLGTLDEGSFRPIPRIYNRVVPEEAAAVGMQPPWSERSTLAVKWAGHPAWFFRWSKASLAYLSHPAIPEVHPVVAAPWPQDLSQWVLKPLFSYGSRGVRVAPTATDLEQISPEERHQWMLMRRVEHAGLIPLSPDQPPAGCEVRVLWIWDNRPRPVTTMVRLVRAPGLCAQPHPPATRLASTVAFFPTS